MSFCVSEVYAHKQPGAFRAISKQGVTNSLRLEPCDWGDRAMKRPRRPTNRIAHKPRSAAKNVDQAHLDQIAVKAAYTYSPYHCRGPKGERPRARAKPATLCPRYWRKSEATKALQAAIKAGRISGVYREGFPRYVWHQADGVTYEARHSGGNIGTYHAYPIDPSFILGALKW